jgi:tetratricopeptide (TPR) repeat protein
MVTNKVIFIRALLLASLTWLTAAAQTPAPHKRPSPTATPSRAATLLQEAETLLQKSEFAQAEEKLKLAVAADARNPQAWFDLGFAQSHLDKLPDSTASYKKAVELSPKWFEASLNLGLVLARSNDAPGAVAILKRTVELTPTGPAANASAAKGRAWLALAEATEVTGTDPQNAAAAYDKAIELQAGGIELQTKAGVQLQRAGDLAAAETHLKKAAEAGDPAGMAALINLLAAQKRYDDAERWLAKYTEQNPQETNARVQHSRLLSSQGKTDAAIAALQAVPQPLSPDVARELSDLYLSAKKYKEAEALMQPLVDRNPRDPQLHLSLGIALLYQLKYAPAQGELLKAVQLKPDMADAYLHLADAARENKNYELAIRALDARAKFLPETPMTYFLRAICFDNLKMLKPAAENYRRFLDVAAGKFPDQEFQARHRLIAIEPQ